MYAGSGMAQAVARHLVRFEANPDNRDRVRKAPLAPGAGLKVIARGHARLPGRGAALHGHDRGRGATSRFRNTPSATPNGLLGQLGELTWRYSNGQKARLSGAASVIAKRQCGCGDPWQHRRLGSELLCFARNDGERSRLRGNAPAEHCGVIGKLIEPGGNLRRPSSGQGRKPTRFADFLPSETMLASPARIEGSRHGEAQ